MLGALLPGKALANIVTNDMGLLKVMISDQQSGKVSLHLQHEQWSKRCLF